jgi:hypothetical protein
MVFSSSSNSAFKPWKRPESYIVSRSEIVELILENPNLTIPQTHLEFVEWVKNLKIVKNSDGKLKITL